MRLTTRIIEIRRESVTLLISVSTEELYVAILNGIEDTLSRLSLSVIVVHLAFRGSVEVRSNDDSNGAW